MTMDKVIKYYSERYRGKSIPVVIKWTPEFLESIRHRFGIYGEFSSNNLIDLFSHIFSGNAARLKLFRLYRQGWFKRNLTNQGYIYSFSEGSKKYNRYYGGFDNGPLVAARIPEVMEKSIEIKREYINSDRYFGEI